MVKHAQTGTVPIFVKGEADWGNAYHEKRIS